MTENPETIAHAFRVLGALFYRSPHDAGMDSLTAYLAGEQLAEEWPWGDPAALAAIAGDFAAGAASPTLAAEHQRLFIGPTGKTVSSVKRRSISPISARCTKSNS